MLPHLRPALSMLALFTILTGVAYPLAITGVLRAIAPGAAQGSLVAHDGQVVGSALIGQAFTEPGYLQPRPSAVSYNAAASGATNYAPTNKAFIAAVAERVTAYRAANGVTPPIDAVTTSASGLDPDVSPENATDQAARIAAARHADPALVRRVIRSQVRGPWLGLYGQARVNVLAANLALDAAFGREPNRPHS